MLNLTELLDFSDLYIKLYVFDTAKSDSDLKNGLGGPTSIYLLISSILKQIYVWLVTQFRSPKIFIDKYILKY